MYLPPLQPVANSDIRICGDVEIHPSASIASGVILQAAPNSKIIIGVDACIGMGVIITAHEGVVEIAEGATLGSGVLIVGHGKVGNNACVGTASTVFNASIDSMAVITPGSIIGDTSRQKPTEKTTDKPESKTEKNKSTSKPTASKKQTPQKDSNQRQKIGNNYFFSKNQNLNNKSTASEDQASAKDQVVEDPSDPWEEKESITTELQETTNLAIEKVEKNGINGNKEISKVYIDRLLVTLFPHKKRFDNNPDSQ